MNKFKMNEIEQKMKIIEKVHSEFSSFSSFICIESFGEAFKVEVKPR